MAIVRRKGARLPLTIKFFSGFDCLSEVRTSDKDSYLFPRETSNLTDTVKGFFSPDNLTSGALIELNGGKTNYVKGGVFATAGNWRSGQLETRSSGDPLLVFAFAPGGFGNLPGAPVKAEIASSWAAGNTNAVATERAKAYAAGLTSAATVAGQFNLPASKTINMPANAFSVGTKAYLDAVEDPNKDEHFVATSVRLTPSVMTEIMLNLAQQAVKSWTNSNVVDVKQEVSVSRTDTNSETGTFMFAGGVIKTVVKRPAFVPFEHKIFVTLDYDDDTSEYVVSAGGTSTTWAAAQTAMIAYENELGQAIHAGKIPLEAKFDVRPLDTSAAKLLEPEELESADRWWKGMAEMRKEANGLPLKDGGYLEALKTQPELTYQNYVAGLARPVVPPVTKPGDTTNWWDSIFSGLGAAGSKVWDTVTTWGPTGLLGGYAGYEAVKSAKGSSIPMWVIAASLGAVVLMISK